QLCGETFGKAAMTRHLAKCVREHEAESTAVGKKKPRKVKLYHLVVQGRYQPEYWMHLEVPETATLADLDNFLRNIWLECCRHMSQFIVGDTFYSVQPRGDDFGMPWGRKFKEHDMRTKVGEVFEPGLEFGYEYDFGSTTELTLKVVSEREGVVKDK